MKENKKLLYISLVFILVIIVLYLVPTKSYSSSSIQIKSQNTLDKFYDNTTLIQEFKADNNYQKIGLYLATYGVKSNDGTLYVDIICDEKTTQLKLKRKNIIDNSVYYFDYKLSKDKNYTVKIYTDGIKENNAITLYTTEYDDDNLLLKINEEEQDSNIIMYFSKKENNYFPIWYVLMIYFIFLSIYPLLKEGKKNEKK